MVSCREFGTLPSGETVHLYHIENSKGEYVELLNYGASIHAICVMDRDGNVDDIVLGAPEGSDLTQCRILGSIIGRCANRIVNGRYEADGKVYQLELNERGGFLHSNNGNYAKKLFAATVDKEQNLVTFSYEDHGEGGFDCNVHAEVSYSFGDDSVLTMTTHMVPDGTTVLNPTNHTYFNLGVSDVRSLHLKVRANYFAQRGENRAPDGGLVSVHGTPADFTGGRTIQDAMNKDETGYFSGHNHNKIQYDEFYLLERKPGLPAAELYCPENGRLLQVVTDMPSLVLFVPDRDQPLPGKRGQSYSGYCAVCLEPGFVPNAVNCAQYDSPIYRKGEALHSVTNYIFKVQ